MSGVDDYEWVDDDWEHDNWEVISEPGTMADLFAVTEKGTVPEMGIEMINPLRSVALASIVTQGVFAKSHARKDIWEQRNTSIHATVYDPCGISYEIRKVINNKGQLACWDRVNDRLIYVHKNKDGTYNVGTLVCTRQPPALSLQSYPN